MKIEASVLLGDRDEEVEVHGEPDCWQVHAGSDRQRVGLLRPAGGAMAAPTQGFRAAALRSRLPVHQS